MAFQKRMSSGKKRKVLEQEEKITEMAKFATKTEIGCNIFSRALKDIKCPGKRSTKKSSYSSGLSQSSNSFLNEEVLNKSNVSIEAPSIPAPVSASSFKNRQKRQEENKTSHTSDFSLRESYLSHGISELLDSGYDSRSSATSNSFGNSESEDVSLWSPVSKNPHLKSTIHTPSLSPLVFTPDNRNQSLEISANNNRYQTGSHLRKNRDSSKKRIDRSLNSDTAIIKSLSRHDSFTVTISNNSSNIKDRNDSLSTVTPERRYSLGSDKEHSLKRKRSSSQMRYSVNSDSLSSTPLTKYSHFPYSYNAKKLLTSTFDIGFIDTHCHLDFLFQRTQHSGTFKEYRAKVEEYFPISYEGCVTIFCDPFTFTNENLWQQIIKEDGVWAAFGCHPHSATDYSHKFDVALRKTLEHPKVKALGEIGLDYSSRNNCDKQIQHDVFERQLEIALEHDFPLVIHCREAHEDCLKIMKKKVPLNHKIHLHCFTDNWTVAKQWLDTFPNLFIGLTNLVTYPSAESVHKVAKNIPVDRLLIETDAPYFLPRTLPRSLRWSHPGLAIHVAAQIIALKDNVISLKEILRILRQNTEYIYGI